MDKQKEPRLRLFETSIEIDQKESKTEFKFKGKGIISTKTLISLISLFILMGLTVFAQVSSIGKTVLETVRHLLPF